MKIIDYELFQVPPRWLFLKITTDEGIVGWGEPVIEGKAATVKAAVHEFMQQLMGENPLNIEDHWNMMYRSSFYRGGPILMSAISGIDQALWDIKGKYYNAPVHELMGGACRHSMKVYSWTGGDRPRDTFDKIESVVERVAGIREAVGNNLGIGIDFHGRVHRPMAKVLAKELEQFNPMFIEEPVVSENIEAIREMSQTTSIPIALGER